MALVQGSTVVSGVFGVCPNKRCCHCSYVLQTPHLAAQVGAAMGQGRQCTHARLHTCVL
jgi:hypothetical protein